MHAPLVACALLLAPAQDPDPIGLGTGQNELSVQLSDNSTCQSCHQSGGTPNDMPADTYRGTMMDLAGVDPVFLASLEVAFDDAPDAAELCIRCHFPRGWLNGRGDGTPEDDFGLLTTDKQGIQCDFCHRMAVPPPADPNSVVPPPELSGVLISNSQVYLYDSSTKQGPLDDAIVSGHQSEYSSLFEDSILCAQCHDVSNTFLELIDDDGNSMGISVPIERTYTEWRSSDYSDESSPDAASCMDCHMAKYDGFAATAGGPPQRPISSHRLVGANVMAPQMVKHLYDDGSRIGFLANIGEAADAASDAAREQLRRAAELEALELVDLGNDRWGLRVKVENKAGHKLPTGYAEGRRMFLAHSVTWANGTQGVRTGVINTSTWEFNVGQGPARQWEVLLSEGLEENHSFHFAKVNRVIKDNRIPPKGFRPLIDTPVVGGNYPEQPDGSLRHWDEVDVALGTGDCWPAIVTATLSFQSSSGAYLSFLINNSDTYGPDLADALAAVGAAPNLMEEIEVAVFPDGTIEPAAGPYECLPPPDNTPPPPVTDAGPGDPPEETDGGVVDPPPPGDDDDDDPGGCTCATRSPADAGLLALALLALVRWRRRR